MCDCINELENPETYEPIDGKAIKSVLIEEAGFTFSRETGDVSRKIVLHQKVQIEGAKKQKRVPFIPAFCCFCGENLSVNSDAAAIRALQTKENGGEGDE
jgi:hypothetical protein